MKYTYENPSPEYKEALELGKQFQREKKTFTGRHSFMSYPLFKDLIKRHNSTTLCDYGCGKGEQLSYRNIRLLNHKNDTEKTIYPSWQEALGVTEYYMYDPCIPEFSNLPTKKYDCLICVDVLEHVIPTDLQDWVIEQMFSIATQWLYASIALFRGKKTLADGSYAHKALCPLEWWLELYSRVGESHPHVEWHLRLEVDIPNITHRYFCGKGKNWEEKEGFFPIWKPKQLEELTPKQRAEMEMLARSQREPVDLKTFDV